MNVAVVFAALLLGADPDGGIPPVAFESEAPPLDPSLGTLAQGEVAPPDPAEGVFWTPPLDTSRMFPDSPPPGNVTGGINFGSGIPEPAPAEQKPVEDRSVSPFRFDSLGLIPEQRIHGNGSNGRFGVFELNLGSRDPSVWPASRIPGFSFETELNYRSWQGPSSPSLPPNVIRFALDFQLTTDYQEPVSFELGFTPALVSDFEAEPNSDTYNWDFRTVAFWRASSRAVVVLGIEFWNRVGNIIVPHAGLIWSDDTWDLRLLFPKSRISYALGTWNGSAVRLYGGVEYNVEAYQISRVSPSGRDEKIQLADYRALFGLSSESGKSTSFIEAGWIFDRHVKYLHGTPGFDIDTGFIARIGTQR